MERSKSSNVVYLDNHATTRVDPRVVEAMLPFFSEQFGNPGSAHAGGTVPRESVEAAREQVATAIGAHAKEIVFTSGATESNNLAIRGVAGRARRRGDHLISVVTEHPAVLDPIEQLGKRGYDVTFLSVQQHGAAEAGRLDPRQVADAIRDDTVLVSVMSVNNEMGVVQPIPEIGAICKERGVLLHCDATQAVGRVPVDVDALGVDLMSFTAHKIYGPKGIGALYVRSRDPVVRLDPQITGGGQMEGRRSGTLNVPGIVGFAAATRLCVDEVADETPRLAALRNRLAAGINDRVDGALVVGPALDATDAGAQPLRVAGNLNLCFPGLDSEALMLAMPGLAVSSGATCASADAHPSHVLSGIGLPADLARGTLRFGLGRFNTQADVDLAIDLVAKAAAKLREFG